MFYRNSIVIASDKFVGEHIENSRQNMYECIDPGVRFLMLSDIILNKIGYSSDTISGSKEPNVAIWPQKNEGYYFKLQKSIRLNSMYPMVCVSLEHYVNELPAEQPLTRYAVIYNPVVVSEIAIVDENLDPKISDSRQGKEATRQALAILSNEAGEDGDILLEKIFDRRFIEVLGRYVLSDLAVIDEASEKKTFDNETIEKALVDHMRREIEILDEIGQNSTLQDSQAKQIIIADAITEPPKANHRGKFTETDIIRSTQAAPFTIGAHWKNNVDPGQ